MLIYIHRMLLWFIRPNEIWVRLADWRTPLFTCCCTWIPNGSSLLSTITCTIWCFHYKIIIFDVIIRVFSDRLIFLIRNVCLFFFEKPFDLNTIRDYQTHFMHAFHLSILELPSSAWERARPLFGADEKPGRWWSWQNCYSWWLQYTKVTSVFHR